MKKLPLFALIASIIFQISCASHSYLAARVQPVTAAPPVRDLRSEDSITFLAFGDAGSGDRQQRSVAQCMEKACGVDAGASRCHFALDLGDNIYNFGVSSEADSQFHRKFEEPYKNFGRFDFWVVPGNHDWIKDKSVQAEIAYTEESQRWRMPNNHFEVPNLPDWLHLYGLDTTVIFDRGRERNAGKRAQLAESERQQIEAAKKALCGKSGWRLLFGHHPIYSSGIHGQEGGNPGVMPALKQTLLPGVIEPCAVQVYFAGHDHDQEHLKAKAFDQVVQGAGGKDLRRIGNVSDQEKKQVFGKSIPGFALVQVTRTQLQMDFYDASACKPVHNWERTLSERQP